mmetsp:Transcript_8945/g.24798  ORF Transcript_8945/g.24798 Transcript_8945/m.24798 type:complete len:276 (-) Transcript_8945:275-1102(-)
MASQIRQHTTCSALVMVNSSCFGNCSTEHPSVTGPNTIGRTINLVDGFGMPDQHVTRLCSEFKAFIAEVLKALCFNVDKDSLWIHGCVFMRPFEVYRGSIILWGFVHGNPETDSFLGCDGSVLVVLMPLETFIRVHHQKIGRNTDLVRSSALAQDISHGRVVVKVSKSLVGLPDISLDVIIEFGGRACKGPKVRVVNLIGCCFFQVIHPLFIKDTLNMNHSIFLESSDLFLCDGKLLGVGNTRDQTVRQGKARVLQAKVVLPESRFFHNLSFGRG